jgi:hypothetical protein
MPWADGGIGSLMEQNTCDFFFRTLFVYFNQSNMIINIEIITIIIIIIILYRRCWCCDNRRYVPTIVIVPRTAIIHGDRNKSEIKIILDSYFYIGKIILQYFIRLTDTRIPTWRQRWRLKSI